MKFVTTSLPWLSGLLVSISVAGLSAGWAQVNRSNTNIPELAGGYETPPPAPPAESIPQPTPIPQPTTDIPVSRPVPLRISPPPKAQPAETPDRTYVPNRPSPNQSQHPPTDIPPALRQAYPTPPIPTPHVPYTPYPQTPQSTQHSSPDVVTKTIRTPPQTSSKWKSFLTRISGYLKLGQAGHIRQLQGSQPLMFEYVGDVQIRTEASYVTQGGIELGAGIELRGQYDTYRRGFGGRVGACPPTRNECASVTTADGSLHSRRGHSSQFYSAGEENAEDFEFALEGAYLFMHTPVGDIIAGRDDGAAYRFSLGAPTLVNVSASNSPVDYTGLDSVKTVNEASGFDEKIVYISPRLLGDRIGAGIQAGLSYAPRAQACGVDYCIHDPLDGVSNSLAPEFEHLIEAGIALDRRFENGLSIEITGTYAYGQERSGFAGFEDLLAWGIGAELENDGWILGGSYLHSNNGLVDGNYTAFDAGVIWKPALFKNRNLGLSLNYGWARDDNVKLRANQIVLALSYDFGPFRMGSGLQHNRRTVPFLQNGTLMNQRERSTAVFVELGTEF